jgi:hypothetical protein
MPITRSYEITNINLSKSLDPRTAQPVADFDTVQVSYSYKVELQEASDKETVEQQGRRVITLTPAQQTKLKELLDGLATQLKEMTP